MKTFEQVTNVEVSNKLKDLGVVYPSIFFRDSRKSKDEDVEAFTNYQDYYSPDNVNCYTVSELGEMLPIGTGMLKQENDSKDTLANILGEHLIELIESGEIYSGDDTAYSWIQ